MIHIKYLGSKSCGFGQKLFFLHICHHKNQGTPGMGPFWTLGHDLSKLDKPRPHNTLSIYALHVLTNVFKKLPFDQTCSDISWINCEQQTSAHKSNVCSYDQESLSVWENPTYIHHSSLYHSRVWPQHLWPDPHIEDISVPWVLASWEQLASSQSLAGKGAALSSLQHRQHFKFKRINIINTVFHRKFDIGR